MLLCTRGIGHGGFCSGLPEDVAVIAAICRVAVGEELSARPLCGICTALPSLSLAGVPVCVMPTRKRIADAFLLFC